MENTSDSFMPGSLLFCMKSERLVCYSVPDNINSFRVAGPDALRSRKKGRKKTLDKPKINDKSQVQEERVVDTSAEHVKELEDELLKLRIANAFLKELRRLRLEDEAKMRERHSSSTASEENSD